MARRKSRGADIKMGEEEAVMERVGDTAAQLIAAAAAEFNEFGFAGTDTNRIARRAGYAPQTFYRWFKDKIEIFIAVYRSWEQHEQATIRDLMQRRASSRQLSNALVAHHRDWLTFRRSLRALSFEVSEVRTARAASRARQIAKIREWTSTEKKPAEIIASLLQIERLADALAEGEVLDMNLSEAGARHALCELIDTLRK